MMLVLIAAMAVVLGAASANAQQPTPLDQGFKLMYNLDFAQAHKVFREYEKLHPEDPMGATGDAAAYLYAEFDRLQVLQSEFFTDDDSFFKRQRSLSPDPAAKREFENALARGQNLATGILSRNPTDENALFTKVLGSGLRADFLAFIEKRNLAALAEVKQGRAEAELLLKQYPQNYDAYLAVGVENYMLSLKPAPVRWILRMSGAQTDKEAGIERLKITAAKGRYLMPYARLLLAVAALRDKDTSTAKNTLKWLVSEFPGNKLYRQELLKLR